MPTYSKRRSFLQALLAIPVVSASGFTFRAAGQAAKQDLQISKTSRLKLSLNAYSFNEPLRNGNMNLDELLEFCAATGFDAVDLTGYYFAGYPNVPSDEVVFGIKRKAFSLGLEISGTGVRNDFAQADESKRRSDINHVKSWIELAAKLGAPVIRIFSGLKIPEGYSWEQVASWMIKDINECVAHGKKYGVIVAVQNHDDFIQTGEQAEKLIRMAKSEWFGLVLDIGSYRVGDPYQQIVQTIPFAVNWQIKENMYENGREVKTDLAKIMAIIKSSGYKGYLPIETLGAGDPKIKVPLFFAEVKKALEQS
jgi:sugar phosphate isomerase/epimerase